MPSTRQTMQRAIAEGFACERCGNCCKGSGAVEIGPAEADRIARHLGISTDSFLAQYATQMTERTWWLHDQANEEQWCVFLERGEDGLYGCRINAAKPDQCASFPAKWRNADSFRTCAGLKTLMSKLSRTNGSSEGRRRVTAAKSKNG